MKSTLRHFIRRLENKFLQLLLSRFIARQTSAPHWGSEELIDLSIILFDELNHDDK